MKIYIFTIVQEKEMTICQVYAESRFKAFINLQLITRCKESEIHYQGKEETTQPQFWGDEL